MRFTALLVLSALALAASMPIDQKQFVAFAQKYAKSYPQNELFTRFNIWKDNMAFIEQENAKNLTYWLGENEFSDLTHEEFLAKMTGCFAMDAMPVDEEAPLLILKGRAAVPNDVDWRTKGAVNPIKNQGSCGSCWAFGTNGALEGAWQIKTGQLIPLSEQQLVDCAGPAGNHGCSGGLPSSAYNWIKSNGGLCKGADYPYTARDGSCKKTCQAVAKVTGFTGVGKTEQAHEQGVTKGPLSIGIDASARGFSQYKGGVFSGPCGTSLNHAVVTIGFTSGEWLIRNSWGTSWGESGYARFARGKNLCGMLNVANYPNV